MAENLGAIRYDIEVGTSDMLKAESVVEKSTTNISNDFKQAEVSVTKSTNTMAKNTQKAASTINTEMTKAAKGVKRGVQANLGQAGIQVQQFVGQLQGGQSAMVALAQQSADLGIVLGAPLVGVVVSLAAVLIGTLSPALFDSGKKVDELREKLEKLVEANTLTREQADVLITAEEKKNKERDKSIKKLKEEEKYIRSQIVLSDNVVKKYDKESETYKKLVKGREDLNNQLNQNIASQQVLNLEIGESTDKIKTYNSVVTDKQVPITKEQKSSIDSLVDSLKTKSDTLGLTARGLALYSAEQILNTEAQKDNLAAVKERINASFDTIDAYEAEQAAIRQTTSDLEWFNSESQKLKDKEATATARLTTQVQSIGLTPLEEIQARYDQELALLNQAEEQKIEIEGSYADRRLQIEAEKQEAIRNMQTETNQFMENAFGNLDTQIAGTMAQVVVGAKDGEDAMRSLANTMLTQVVGALVQQGIELIKNKVLGNVLATSEKANILSTTATGVAAQQTATTSTAAAAATTATAAAPAAALTSTFSFGSAALIGGAALLGTLAIAKMMGGRQYGGPVSSGMYRVNETGVPEIYSQGGKDYLMNTKNANIKPLDKASGGGGGMTVNVSNNTPYEVYVTQDQAASIANVQIGKESKLAAKGRGNMFKALSSSSNLRNQANRG